MDVLDGPQVEIGHQESVPHLVLACAARLPQQVALRWIADGEMATLTYGDLVRRAAAGAAVLAGRGVGPGATVAVCLERGPEVVLAWLSILMTGAAYLPLEPDHPLERLAFQMSDAGVSLLISRPTLWPRPPAGVELLDAATLAAGVAEPHPPAVGSDAVAAVLYTSGSTGRPKGVEVPHRGMLRLVRSPFITWTGETFLLHSALSFDLSTFEVWGPLCNGSTCAIAPAGPVGLADLQAAIERLGVTTLWLTAGLFHAVAAFRLEALAPLRQLCAGGDVLDPGHVAAVLARHPGLRLVNGYGPTELSTFTTCHVMVGGSTLAPGPVPIGLPIANTRVVILDADLAPVARGGIGELCAGGDGVALGYRGQPERTAERFVMITTPEGPLRVYRTGDLARIDDQGLVEFVGRVDDQVKIRGIRVEPSEVTSLLRTHTGVAAAVTVVRRQGDDGLLDAYVVPVADLSSGSDAGAVEHRWREVYEATYHVPEPTDPLFHAAGWNSSYDDRPLPAADLEELIDGTARRLLAGSPRSGLEVGCGTGLLLLRLARHMEVLHGTDIAPTGLDHIRRSVAAGAAGTCRVEVRQAAGGDPVDLPPASLDLVWTNSVIQCFPDEAYLERTLQSMAALVVPGGRLVVGDVRHAGLQSAYHTSVARHRIPGDHRAGAVVLRIEAAAMAENQLLVHPRWFQGFVRRLGPGWDLRVLLKSGLADNEMLAFRYDVVLFRRSAGTAPDVAILWGPDAEAAVASALASGRTVALLGVPNPRTATWCRLLDVARQQPEVTWAEAIAVGGAPVAPTLAHWEAQATAWGAAVEASWSRGLDAGACDLLFAPHGRELPAHGTPVGSDPAALLTDPARAEAISRLARDLVRLAAQHLPEAMRPRSITVLAGLPLTASDKVDRSLLPLPLRSARGPTAVAETPIQSQLVALWEEVLGVAPIGLDDRLHDLGGTSLTAVTLMERVRTDLGIEMSLTVFLADPTIRTVAHGASGRRTATPALLRCLKEGPAGVPLLAALEYFDVVNYLAPDRPYWLLDAPFEEKVRDRDLTIARVVGQLHVAVTTQIPEGRIILAGHSYGAVVAWELARILGPRVAGLVLFDPPVLASLGSEPSQRSRWFWHLRRLMQSSPDEMVSRLARGLRNASFRWSQGDDDDIFADFTYTTVPCPVLAVYPQEHWIRTDPSRDPRRHLAGLSPALTEIDVPGDHFTLLRQPHLTGLGQRVAAWIRERAP